jgi:5-methylcytosine-specific restriction endonuclease McrA
MPKPCANCSEPVADRDDYTYCTRTECKKMANRERMRAYYARVGGNKNRKPHHKTSKNVWTDSRKAASQARRALKVGATAEKFAAREVFNRDGWICGICTEPVNPSLLYPHRLSVSLDHIVPLSLGGTHTRDNTRCSHLTCNVTRGNRV